MYAPRRVRGARRAQAIRGRRPWDSVVRGAIRMAAEVAGRIGKIMQMLVGTHAVRVLECDREAGHAASAVAVAQLPGAIFQSSQLVQKDHGTRDQ